MDTHEPRVYCFFIPPKHIKATSCQLEWLNISIKHYLIISMLFEHKLKKYFILYVLNPATTYINLIHLNEVEKKHTRILLISTEPQGCNTMGGRLPVAKCRLYIIRHHFTRYITRYSKNFQWKNMFLFSIRQ